MRAPRDDAARWVGGAVIPSPALLLLLQTRKTLHHKGVWLLPQAPFLAAALRGASERARRLFLPLDLGAADWLRAGISGPRLPLHRQQLAASAVISCQPVMVADDDGVIWELSCETAPTKSSVFLVDLGSSLLPLQGGAQGSEQTPVALFHSSVSMF